MYFLQAIKEQFTIARPHIAEGFYEKMKTANQKTEDDDVIVINKVENFLLFICWTCCECLERYQKICLFIIGMLFQTEFASAINWLGNAIMDREKQNFESYSMFYENLLKHNARLLFKQEQVHDCFVFLNLFQLLIRDAQKYYLLEIYWD